MVFSSSDKIEVNCLIVPRNTIHSSAVGANDHVTMKKYGQRRPRDRRRHGLGKLLCLPRTNSGSASEGKRERGHRY